MDEAFDESKPSSCINYLDANNLYGLAMSQKLPLKNIKWTKKTPNIEMKKMSTVSSLKWIWNIQKHYTTTIRTIH